MSIHAREHLHGGDCFLVNCTHQANVLVMDDTNLSYYRSGQSARYYGGFFRRLPARIAVPSTGYWNVVLEAPAGARYGMQVLRS